MKGKETWSPSRSEKQYFCTLLKVKLDEFTLILREKLLVMK